MKIQNFLRSLWLWAMLLIVGSVGAQVTTQEAFVTACANAASGDVITLGSGEFNLNAIKVTGGKSLTFVGNGTENTTLKYGSAYKQGYSDGGGVACYSFDGSGFITIKDAKLEDYFPNDGNDYDHGFVRAGGMLFEDCEIASSAGCWGNNTVDGTGVTFKNCLFTAVSTSFYSVVTYQANSYVFEGCTFAGNAKGAVKLYRTQDKGTNYNFVIKDCKFEKGSNTGKTPIYFYNDESNGGVYNIFIEGTNENVNNSYSVNSTSGSWIWGDYRGSSLKSAVYNAGVCVFENGAIKAITAEEVPSSVAQTVADVAVTKDETATEVESSAATAAVNTVVANTATVNETTTIAAESVEGVSSTKNYLHIDVKAAEVAKNEEQAYVKSMTFDIKPIAATITDGKLSTEVIPNDNIKSAITFRLPVDANATETTAEVFHNGESMGADYQVQGTTEKYIEVSTTEFSEFGYQLLDAPAATYVAQIGDTKYESLAEAVAAAQNEDEIVVLSNYKGSDENSLIVVDGKTLTLNLNGYTIEGSGCDGVIWAKNSANVTIQGNGTVIANECKNCDPSEGYGYAVRASSNSTITIKNGSYKLIAYNPATQKDMIYASGASTINIEGGYFESDVPGFTLNLRDNSGSKMSVTGGTFVGFNPADNKAEGENTNFVAEGYKSVDNGDGTYTVKECEYIAQIGDTKYESLAEAVAAAQNEDEIVVLSNYKGSDESSLIVVNGKTLTLNLNGYTIEGSGCDGVIWAKNSANVTIQGNGTVIANECKNCDSSEGYGYAVRATSNSTITIKNGSYKLIAYNLATQKDMIYASGASTINIEGGYFESDVPGFTLNLQDNSGSKMSVTGGTFYGFNPANNNAEGEHTNFVAEGYTAKDNGDGSYTVVACAYVAQIGVANYATLAEAVAAAQNGQTIKMIADAQANAMVEISGKNITLDLNGKTISPVEGTRISGGLIGVHNGAKLTIDDTSYDKLGTITSGTDGKVYGAVQVTVKNDVDTNPATLVVKNGNLEGYYYGIVGNGARHNTDITIEGGTITGLANSPATDDMGYAIYHPQAGTLTISGGTLVGPAAAIEMRAGKLDITDGSFEATATAFKEAWNGSGTTITGAAIAISQHSTNKDIKVDISGGTFKGIKALYEKDLNPSLEDNSYNINLAVEGGSFNGAIYSQNDEEFISGGLFSDPNADIYCQQNLTVANKAQGSELLKVEALTDETAIVAITESNDSKIYYSKLQAENRYLSLEDGIKSIDVKEKVAFKDIAYHRTFNASAGYWQAWIAPFDCTPSSYYYDFAEISMLAYYRPSEKTVVTDDVQAGDELVIVLNPLDYGARVKANYPYCVRVPEYRKGDSITFFAETDDNDAKTYLHKTEPKQISSSTTSTKFTFNGVYKQTSMTDIYMVATDGSYSHMTNTKTVNPFRWYFTVTNDSQYGTSAPDYNNSNIRFLVFGEDEEATAIMNAINNHPEAEQIYDLSGRLIQQMGHGISVINGKKVINN